MITFWVALVAIVLLLFMLLYGRTTLPPAAPEATPSWSGEAMEAAIREIELIEWQNGLIEEPVWHRPKPPKPVETPLDLTDPHIERKYEIRLLKNPVIRDWLEDECPEALIEDYDLVRVRNGMGDVVMEYLRPS